ncbi:MAG TPA: hypothetical protein VF699_02855 [Caulobacteraceae bacterium]|jgi:hypothetical protein
MVDQSMGSRAGRRPWHLWVVGVVAVLWNGFGAYDYTMTNLQGDPYLRSMGITDAQLAYFHEMPAWMTAVWAIGVWGAVLGSVLLLVRRRWALPAFAVSLLAVVMSLIYAFFLSRGGELMGEHAPMQFVVLGGAVFFAWYAWWMTKRGVLR